MSKLSETYASVQNQLQYGPGLAPFFEALVVEIDSLKAGDDPQLTEMIKQTENDEQARMYKSMFDMASNIGESKNDIGVLVDQVAALTEQVKELQQTIAVLTEPKTASETAHEAQPVAAAPGITDHPPSVSKGPQPEPDAAAPTSTTGAE